MIVLVVIDEWKNQSKRDPIKITFITSVFMINVYLFFGASNSFSEDALKIKAYKLGLMYDFNQHHDCKAVSESESILFLTPDHEWVIKAFPITKDRTFERFYNDKSIDNYPEIGSFKRIRCSTEI